MIRQATSRRSSTTMMKAVRRTINRTAAMNPWKKTDSQPPPVVGGPATGVPGPTVGLGVKVAVWVGVDVEVGVSVGVGVEVGVSVGVGVGVSVGVGVGVGVSVDVGLGAKVAVGGTGVGGTGVGGTRVGARVAVGRGYWGGVLVG
jgi:hypothetical protein